MSRTVLIADESITIRSVAESLLRGEAFSVHSAADGQMAIEIARAERPDLALVGERLSGLSGADVCRTLKSDPELRGIPIILMRSDRPGPAPEHADAVLTKPFSPQSLLDAVHRFVTVDSAREGTAPVPIDLSPEPGLEEELIDQALGLDDVGPAPAEEREVGKGRGADSLEPGSREERAPLGLVDDVLKEASGESTDEHLSKALDESFGLLDAEAEPADLPTDEAERLELETTPRRDTDFDLDLAIDAAFGDGPKDRPHAAEPPAPSESSSLKEVSLGDTGTEPQGPRPPASSAAPGAGIDLGTPEEAPEDRPHDYDWFIKEMQKDKGSRQQHAAPPEPPHIEPVVPRSAASATTDKGGESRRSYDEFITEFRAEIARIEGMAAPGDPLLSEETDRSRHSQKGEIAFEQTGENPGPPVSPPAPPATVEASIRAWGDELIDSVTSQVARELAAKIDSKVIYTLIEQKLKEAQKHRS